MTTKIDLIPEKTYIPYRNIRLNIIPLTDITMLYMVGYKKGSPLRAIENNDT